MAKDLIPINKFTLTYKPENQNVFQKIDTIEDAVKKIRPYIDIETQKHSDIAYILLLTPELQILGMSELSKENIFLDREQTCEIIRLTLLSNAEHIMLFFSRSNTNLRPSREETFIISEFQKSANLVQIDLFDVVFLDAINYFSLLGKAML